MSLGVDPLTYSNAKRLSRMDPFDYVCNTLLQSGQVRNLYDYIFVDEGQDFPASFIRLCSQLAKKERVVWAYDDLQTIFQAHAPTPDEVFGIDKTGKPLVELNLDTVLHKCYRNPREVLVAAHALGFGIYGKIVQMLENKKHWEDIGYSILEGAFAEGEKIVIQRPEEFSLTTISDACSPQTIVEATVYDSFDAEILDVASRIQADIKDGLRPDDVLVIVVDDRSASNYLQRLSKALADKGIKSNNVHSDSFGLRDFYKEHQVTLSTVHKAKGNEAYAVYVVGVDALFSSTAGVRERNMLFTGMTRAKGWVHVSGLGEWAEACKKEIIAALENFPNLVFSYPSEEELKVMKRDLTEKGERKLKMERLLETVMEEMGPEEIAKFVEYRSIEKGASD